MTDDAPTVRRGTAGLALLAMVFLAIIGASVGVIIGLRSDGTTSGPPDGGLGAGTGSSTATPPASASHTPPVTASGTPPVIERCLEHTEKLARDKGSPGGLVVHAYYLTSGSEVWICKDTAGTLWYQGHRGGPADRVLVEGDNALFLATVQRIDGGYVATNQNADGRTDYRVTRRLLRIEQSSHGVIEQPVTAYHGEGA